MYRIEIDYRITPGARAGLSGTETAFSDLAETFAVALHRLVADAFGCRRREVVLVPRTVVGAVNLAPLSAVVRVASWNAGQCETAKSRVQDGVRHWAEEHGDLISPAKVDMTDFQLTIVPEVWV